MTDKIYTRLTNKNWLDKHNQRISFQLVGENIRCTHETVGTLFETNGKVTQKILDSNHLECIESVVNFVTEEELFITVLSSTNKYEVSTYFYFLKMRSEKELLLLSSSIVSPKIESKGRETIGELRVTKEIFKTI